MGIKLYLSVHSLLYFDFWWPETATTSNPADAVDKKNLQVVSLDLEICTQSIELLSYTSVVFVSFYRCWLSLRFSRPHIKHSDPFILRTRILGL